LILYRYSYAKTPIQEEYYSHQHNYHALDIDSKFYKWAENQEDREAIEVANALLN
jgi:hypothetical protein